jgi:hypothetical protein
VVVPSVAAAASSSCQSSRTASGTPGGRQRLELGRADMVGEHPQQLRRLRVGGHLMHRVGTKVEPMVVTEPAGLL